MLLKGQHSLLVRFFCLESSVALRSLCPQVISPLILQREILHFKRACFGLWLIERRILYLERAK